MKKEKVKRLYVEDDVMSRVTYEDINLRKIEEIRQLLRGRGNVIFKEDIRRILNS